MEYGLYNCQYIYNCIMKQQKFMGNFEELERYRHVLYLIFNQIPVFTILIDGDTSARIVRLIIETIKKMNPNMVDNIDWYLLCCCKANSAWGFYENVEMIFDPKTASKNIFNYLCNFEKLYTHQITYVGTERLSWFNRINKIMECTNSYSQVYDYYHHEDKRLIYVWSRLCMIATACFYANQDEFDLNVLDKFYLEAPQLVEHYMLNVGGQEENLCNYFGLHLDNKEILENMYNYVLDNFKRIKEEKEEKRI